MLLAYVTLSPAVWERGALVALPISAAVVGPIHLVLGIFFGRSAAQAEVGPGTWLRVEASYAIEMTTILTVFAVIFGPVGASQNLSNAAQQITFGLCCLAVVACRWSTHRRNRRRAAAEDKAREGRLEEARVQARRNVAEYFAGIERSKG